MLFVTAVLANEHKTSIKIFTLGGGLHAEQGIPSLLFPLESQKVHCSASLSYWINIDNSAPESFFFPRAYWNHSHFTEGINSLFQYFSRGMESVNILGEPTNYIRIFKVYFHLENHSQPSTDLSATFGFQHLWSFTVWLYYSWHLITKTEVPKKLKNDIIVPKEKIKWHHDVPYE